jgi:hypothetical protein
VNPRENFQERDFSRFLKLNEAARQNYLGILPALFARQFRYDETTAHNRRDALA